MGSFLYSSKNLSSQDPKLKLRCSYNEESFVEKGPCKLKVVMMPKYGEDNYICHFLSMAINLCIVVYKLKSILKFYYKNIVLVLQ